MAEWKDRDKIVQYVQENPSIATEWLETHVKQHVLDKLFDAAFPGDVTDEDKIQVLRKIRERAIRIGTDSLVPAIDAEIVNLGG